MNNNLVNKILVVLRANQARLEGRIEDGIRLLGPQLDGSELLLAHVVLHDLQRDAANESEMASQEAWLRTHRGQAFSEAAVGELLQPLNVVELARILNGKDAAVVTP